MILWLFIFTIHLITARDWESEWKIFQTKFNKTYTSQAETFKRFQIFMDNKLILESWNEAHGFEVFGSTEYTDLTYAEFSDLKLGYSSNGISSLPEWDSTCYSCHRFPEYNNSIPKTLDWVSLGAVNSVRNQERCGSCWAFSTVSSAESAIFIGGGELQNLSEEELVQCAQSAGHGCKGGEMQAAFDWILNSENGFMDNEADYPYTSGGGNTGDCKKFLTKPSLRSRISGAVSINYFGEGDEDVMMDAVAQIGPLSVGINAKYLHHYIGGILDPEVCTSALNHGVVIVGYGIENEKEYWKVRNSWGYSWGENGYFRLKKGDNKCGISEDVSAAYFVDEPSPSNHSSLKF